VLAGGQVGEVGSEAGPRVVHAMVIAAQYWCALHPKPSIKTADVRAFRDDHLVSARRVATGTR
jgi:hypothetical protein